MNVTIYSDASLCPGTEVGGWAGWVKSDRGTMTAEGQLKSKTRDTTIAEAMAAVNSMALAISRKNIVSGDLIILTTDNDNVMEVLLGRATRSATWRSSKRKKKPINLLKKEAKASNRMIDEISSVYSRLTRKYNLEVRWAHVKGHRGLKDKRSAVNHGCDRRARSEMKEARKGALPTGKVTRRNWKRRRRKKK